MTTSAALVAWIHRRGGFVDPRQQVAVVGPGSPAAGVLAREPIAEGERLLSVPWDLTISTPSDGSSAAGGLRDELAREQALPTAAESERGPFLRALVRGDEPAPPAAWSARDRARLAQLLGGTQRELSEAQTAEQAEPWEVESAGDPLRRRAALLLATRSVVVPAPGGDGEWLEVLAPFYDLYTHRNGRWTNTVVRAAAGEPFEVFARRDVAAGEFIHTTRGRGTPDLFVECGFVEPVPRWWWCDASGDGADRFEFEEDEDEDGDPVITWSPDYSVAAVARAARATLDRLRLAEDTCRLPPGPDPAARLTEQYLVALKGALKRLLVATGADDGPPEPYVCDPIRLDPGDGLELGDRRVRADFLMSDPNLAVVEGLLSLEECEQLIAACRDRLERSTVVSGRTGASVAHPSRTSEGTCFQLGETALVAALEDRIARLTGVPVGHGEGLQILRYGVGAEFRPHQDFFDPSNPASAEQLVDGGQRIATLILYLNDVEAGGATEFPELSVSVQPRPGRAVYFEYLNRKGRLDERCLHAGTPVLQGEKWIATKWLRRSARRPAARPGPDPTEPLKR